MGQDTIVVFAGAGASKAVDPKQYPTTVEFFERLPEAITVDALFKEIVERFKRVDPPAVIDIERVLWALEELNAFARLVNDDKGVVGWLLRKARLGLVLGMNQNYENVLGSALQLIPVIDRLSDSINRTVYEFFSAPPPQAGLEATWLPLLKPLVSQRAARVELFTTNYDLNLEAAAAALAAKDIGYQKIETGRQDGFLPRLDLRFWTEDRADQGGGGLLTKLHGSVHWSRSGDEIFIGDPAYKGSHTRHVIIYPGFKGVSGGEPFAMFHQYLRRVLVDAKKLLFIGFAFRDEHLNDLLRQGTRSDADIIVLNPDAVYGPYEASRVTSITRPFDRESTEQALRHLGMSM